MELYGDRELSSDSWGGGGWGGHWDDEDEMFRPKEVTLREGGRRKRDTAATDSGTYANENCYSSTHSYSDFFSLGTGDHGTLVTLKRFGEVFCMSQRSDFRS